MLVLGLRCWLRFSVGVMITSGVGVVSAIPRFSCIS